MSYAIVFVVLTSRPTGRKREREGGESEREPRRERERRGENTLYTNRLFCMVPAKILH